MMFSDIAMALSETWVTGGKTTCAFAKTHSTPLFAGNKISKLTPSTLKTTHLMMEPLASVLELPDSETLSSTI